MKYCKDCFFYKKISDIYGECSCVRYLIQQSTETWSGYEVDEFIMAEKESCSYFENKEQK